MQPPDALPATWQRLLALSGVAFALLFLIGWFASGGDTPDYGATDQDWTDWADDNRWKSRIGAFAMLLAGFVFLHFAGMIRSTLGRGDDGSRFCTTRTSRIRGGPGRDRGNDDGHRHDCRCDYRGCRRKSGRKEASARGRRILVP